MSERFTSDVPAYPDSNYVWVNPKYKDTPSIHEQDEDFWLLTLKEYGYEVETLFETSDALEFIDEFAVYDDDGRLNIELTSIKIGIPYSFDMESTYARGEIAGLPGMDSGKELEIHLDPRQLVQQITFGHEIGHFFYRAIHGAERMGYNPDEEEFCEYFGRRMAMKPEYIQEFLNGDRPLDEDALMEIMSRFRLELKDTITCLMELGVLPPRVAVDSYNPEYPNEDFSLKVKRNIHCLHCARVDGDFNCPGADQPTPLFNFTDRAWGNRGGFCLSEELRDPAIMSTLTAHYVSREEQLLLFRPE